MSKAQHPDIPEAAEHSPNTASAAKAGASGFAAAATDSVAPAPAQPEAPEVPKIPEVPAELSDPVDAEDAFFPRENLRRLRSHFNLDESATANTMPGIATAIALLALWMLHFLPFHFEGALHAQWYTLLSAGLSATTLNGTIFATVVLIVFAYPAERILGTLRFTVLAVLLQVLSTMIGLALAAAVANTSQYWGEQLGHDTFATPTIWAFGVAGVASARMHALWRRRTRVVLAAVAMGMFLYAGLLNDFPRVVAALLGIALGQWLFVGDFARGPVSRREMRVLVATLIAVVTVGPLLASFVPGSAGPLSELTWMLEGDAYTGVSGVGEFVRVTLANHLPVVIMLVAAYGLARGRRFAWWLVLVSQVLSLALLVLVLDFDGQQYVVSRTIDALGLLLPNAVAIAVLVVQRKLFSVRIQRRFLPFVVWAVLCAAVWLVGSWMLRFEFRPVWSWQPLSVLRVFFPPQIVGDPVFVPVTAAAWVVSTWPGIVFMLGFAVLLYWLLLSVPQVDQDQQRAREILLAGGGDHLAWMTLWPRNSFWFVDQVAGGGAAAGAYVCFQVHNSVAITVGEPVLGVDCPHTVDEVAEGFERYAAAQGWRVAWYSVRDAFRRPGYRAMNVAEESVIDVTDADAVAFKGKKFQDIRTARNRAKKEGVQCRWVSWNDAGIGLREKITALSEDWVADKSLPEMGFTLGGLPELRDDRVHLMVAIGSDGTLHGVTSWLPAYEDGQVVGWVLDFMRRNPEGFRPVVEFLIAETIVKAAEDGLQWVSLSGAPLANADSSFLDWLGEMLEPLYGFRSLAFFKRKFHPNHESWVLLYNDELALPAIGMAITKCYLPHMTPRQLVHVAKKWAQG